MSFHIDIVSIVNRLWRESLHVGFAGAGGEVCSRGWHTRQGRPTVLRGGTLRPPLPCRRQDGLTGLQSQLGRLAQVESRKLAAHVRQPPDATLHKLKTAFAVSHNVVWASLRHLGLTSKETRNLPGTQRGAAVALPPRGRATGVGSGKNSKLRVPTRSFNG